MTYLWNSFLIAFLFMLTSEVSAANNIYRFSEYFSSIKWLSHLPDSILRDQVDLRFSAVTISPNEDGKHIYVGPIDSDKGGSAVSIFLDENLNLIDYEIEHLEPLPIDR